MISKNTRLFILICCVFVGVAAIAIALSYVHINVRYSKTLVGPTDEFSQLLYNDRPLEEIERAITSDPKVIRTYHHDRMSLLAFAAERQRPDVVRLLIKMGASVNGDFARIKAGLEKPPLLVSVQMENVEITKILLDAGADPFLATTSSLIPGTSVQLTPYDSGIHSPNIEIRNLMRVIGPPKATNIP